jgi:hypothetical protein
VTRLSRRRLMRAAGGVAAALAVAPRHSRAAGGVAAALAVAPRHSRAAFPERIVRFMVGK